MKHQAPVHECPSAAQLRELLSGEVARPDQAALETHLNTCETCRDALSRLSDGPDTLVWKRIVTPSAVREAAPRDPSDRPRRAFLERVKRELPFATDEEIEFPGPPTPSAPLGQLGAHEILAELGRGGMGVVYLARDSRLARLVALKVMKPELASSPADRQRFFREGRAAAAIKDEHVVAVLQAEHEPDFRLPYLVMEYVEGIALDRLMATRGPLPPEESARIALQAARGLATAHQHGLVHRDIKPSNILVETASGRVKIADFGLARRSGADTQQLTQPGGVLGTPAYMSPEHILAADQVDARSDLFSLGAVLYELLTGAKPFSGLPHMVMSQILHEDPLPPRRLNDAVPRDLETICLKLLRKRPADRYASSQAAADDLHRFLKGEPIAARPVGGIERMRKWARRNPRVAILLSSVALLLVLLAGGSLAAALVIGRSWNQEAAARSRADRRTAQARRAVDEMYTQVAQQWLADQPHMQPLQREFLQKALAFYEELAKEQSADPAIARQTALALRRVGDIQLHLGDHRAAEAAYARAVAAFESVGKQTGDPEDRSELAITQMNRGLLLVTMSRGKDAKAAYDAAQSLLEKLVADHPGKAAYRAHLASCLSNLSQWHKGQGQPRDGERACRRAIALQRQLLQEFPADRRYQSDLATSLVHLGLALEQLGRHDDALDSIQEGLDEQRQAAAGSRNKPTERYDLANTLTHLARLQAAAGDMPSAHTTLMEVRQTQERLRAEFPGVPLYRTELVSTLNALANLQKEMGRPDDAQRTYREAIDLQQSLADQFPHVTDHRAHLAGITANLAALLKWQGRGADAIRELAELIERQEALAGEHPENVDYQVALAISFNNYGNVLDAAGQGEEAEKALRRAAEIYRRLVARSPDSVTLQHHASGSLSNLCRVLAGNGKLAEAERTFRETIADQERLAAGNPKIGEYRQNLATTIDNLGTLLDEADRADEAERELVKAGQVRERLAKEFPDNPDYQRDLSGSLNNLSVFYDSHDQHEAALKPLEEAMAIREQLHADQPGSLLDAVNLCATYGNLGRHWRLVGDQTAAIEWLDKTVELAGTILKSEPAHPETRQILRNAFGGRAMARDALGRHDEALADLDAAIELNKSPAMHAQLRAHRSSVLLHQGQHAEAAAEAQAAAELPAVSGRSAFELAGVLATASESATEEAEVERLQVLAVKLLAASCQSGFVVGERGAAKCDQTTALNALRLRDDFLEVMKQLRSAERVLRQE